MNDLVLGIYWAKKHLISHVT